MDASELLRAWSEGDEAAFNELVPLIERELRRLRPCETRPVFAADPKRSSAVPNLPT